MACSVITHSAGYDVMLPYCPTVFRLRNLFGCMAIYPNHATAHPLYGYGWLQIHNPCRMLTIPQAAWSSTRQGLQRHHHTHCGAQSGTTPSRPPMSANTNSPDKPTSGDTPKKAQGQQKETPSNQRGRGLKNRKKYVIFSLFCIANSGKFRIFVSANKQSY